MPVVEVADGTRVAYALAGRPDGEPLLMIQGLGADSRGWLMQRRALGARHRLIMVDNRGVGRSADAVGPYALATMADDAAAVLDHAGYRSAHVVGASMGGILAQLLAVQHPERVRSLVLACTACRHEPWRIELLEEWIEEAESLGMREFVRRNLRWMVGPRSLKRLWPAMTVLGPLAFNTPVESFVAQVRAILGVDDRLRGQLEGIAVPTLVMVGSQDVLTTQGDAEEIAELIPGADLRVVRGGAHLFMVEQAGTFNRAVGDFLSSTTGLSSGARPVAGRPTDQGPPGASARPIPGGAPRRRSTPPTVR